MATLFFNKSSSSKTPFTKATHKAEISFLRNPQRESFEDALNYLLYEFGNEFELSLVQYLEHMSSIAYSSSLM